jgi:hypothetical protein
MPHTSTFKVIPSLARFHAADHGLAIHERTIKRGQSSLRRRNIGRGREDVRPGHGAPAGTNRRRLIKRRHYRLSGIVQSLDDQGRASGLACLPMFAQHARTVYSTKDGPMGECRSTETGGGPTLAQGGRIRPAASQWRQIRARGIGRKRLLKAGAPSEVPLAVGTCSDPLEPCQIVHTTREERACSLRGSGALDLQWGNATA